MPPQSIVKELLTLPTLAQQKQFLRSHASTVLQDEQVTAQVAQALKAQADHFLRTEIEKSLQLVENLFYLADLTDNILYRALGLRAKGNVYGIGQGDHKRAIETYNEAAAIYEDSGYQVEQAVSQVGKIWSLALLGNYDQAFEIGEWACEIFETHEEWFRLAQMKGNLSIIHGRLKDDYKSLILIEEAQKLYQRIGEAGQKYLAIGELNRSVALHYLGQFEGAIQANKLAYAQLTQLNQTIEAARAQQVLAGTYFTLGRYNEALVLLNQVLDVFLDDKRWGDAILLELFISDYLLQLGHFTEVRDKCYQVRQRFQEYGLRLEVGRAILNEALAYAGLHQYAEALDSLTEARHLFELEKNDVFVATTELERAAILRRQGKFELSLEVALQCVTFFREKGLVMEEARSKLLAAQAALALERYHLAKKVTREVLELGQLKDISWLRYQAHFLLGRLAEAQSTALEALYHYEKAIDNLEWLQGRLMVEFRSDYLQDKAKVYEHIVRLCLSLKKDEEALTYAERAKSRTLRDLLDRRVTLQIQPQDEKDKSLIQELEILQRKRNQIVIRWEGEREAQEQTRQEVLALERQITQKWHRLLIRNASYAREAELWYVYQEKSIPLIQKSLDAETILLEYFIAQQEIIVFLVTTSTIKALSLPATIAQVNSLLQKFILTLNLVPRSKNKRLQKLTARTGDQLSQLYDLLIAPIEEVLADYSHLIIVPHGPLHYLPFHALCDGGREKGQGQRTGVQGERAQRAQRGQKGQKGQPQRGQPQRGQPQRGQPQGLPLLQKYNITYLPSASLLHHYHKTESTQSDIVTFGYSNNEQLPYTINEANSIAKIMGGEAFIEEQASLANLRQIAPHCRILHLSTHGDFRADNPIFSGLTLYDGQLTTLDTFNLRLNASLVTLSACQTGRHLIGGGDELLGLTRAFLYAGAASLVLSLWRVYDHSTTLLMERFYQKLADGYSKSEALRQAQCEFINQAGQPNSAIPARYAHPYYWAAFFLVGHAGSL